MYYILLAIKVDTNFFEPFCDVLITNLDIIERDDMKVSYTFQKKTHNTLYFIGKTEYKNLDDIGKMTDSYLTNYVIYDLKRIGEGYIETAYREIVLKK